ncbi:hypothetical protein DL98DRAFT_523261 [Cadophora sp. DSE1049]|nr:hypothetical protein DL98DRAFT_523261 [Cadophora sp. DSE1049]
MKSSLMYVSLAIHFVLSSAMHGHQMKPRQEVNSTESDPVSLYLWQMCSPDTFSYITGFNADGQVFPHLASSSFPCDQTDYILNSCMANATDPAVDFAAEQQCLVCSLPEAF